MEKMIDLDYSLSQITERKQHIIHGIAAADVTLIIIGVIRMACNYATEHDKFSISDEILQQEGIPIQYKSIITASSQSSSGMMTIPGLYHFLDLISDQIPIINQSFHDDISSISDEVKENTSRLFLFNSNIKSLDYVSNDPTLSFFTGEGMKGSENLTDIIQSLKKRLVLMLEEFVPYKEYDAFCYLLESVDLYLVRSFMQGIKIVRTGDLYADVPYVIAVRDHPKLIIGYFFDEFSEKFCKIEIQGLNISVSMYGSYEQYQNGLSGIIAPSNSVWSKNIIQSKIFDGYEIKNPLIIGSFHARSLEEVMLFLSDTANHISRNFTDFSISRKIAG